MFRLPPLALTALLAFGVAASAQTVPPLGELRAKVDAFVRRAYPAVDPARAHVEYADINSDGEPEAFVIIRDRTSCGEDGCALVLDLGEPTAREIAAFAGGELRALQTKSGSWRDIMLDGRRLRWRNGAYE
jgi:hypothetical protein